MKIKQYKLPNWNNRENRSENKMKKNQGAVESITSYLTFMLSESQKDRRKGIGMKKYLKK